MAPVKRTSLLASVALSTLLAGAGCATAEKNEAGDEREQFQYVNETGSLIPKKVRKGKQQMDRGQNFEILETNRLEQMQRDQMIRNMPRDRPGT